MAEQCSRRVWRIGHQGLGEFVAQIEIAGRGLDQGPIVGDGAEVLQAAAAAIEQAGGEAWWTAIDVRDAAAIEALVAATVDRFGAIDLLINNAGSFKLTPFEDMTLVEWRDTLDVNLTGAFICAKAVGSYLSGEHIINVSSVAGVQAYAGCAAYSASKYGLIGLSEVLALEGKARNIRVHVICPGNTQT
ncbi:MAG TPA: SDR family NAD(P)-dependent oxidoreductase, partial [Anaerolineae bacterium]|nr:SDR family NAD(P)-dependent oxidoreductase [Anaerolineae bacterium]